MDVEALKKMNNDRKLGKKYNAFLVSKAIIKQIPRLLGPCLNRTGKFSVLLCLSWLIYFFTSWG
jgi:large subunit ribosomal protein L10Ae